MTKIVSALFCLFLFTLPLVGCNDKNQTKETETNSAQLQQQDSNQTSKSPVKTDSVAQKPNQQDSNQTVEKPSTQPVKTPTQAPPTTGNGEAIQVVAKPDSIPVLINKQNKLPETYTPNDLVFTTIPFIFQEKNEKRKMRSEASAAITELFAGAKVDGITLLGVSGYRSHATQVALFNNYVKKDGYEKARTYSALPGTSEHETGLAIDVTGGTGQCPAQDCFANTPEAKWLQNNVAKYGFIIRYPNGKSNITGYKYEPWHLRYVGPAIATEIMSKGITLEEYNNTIQVNN
jgi:zinc D-Ala-D-Ala carboxypeptidase